MEEMLVRNCELWQQAEDTLQQRNQLVKEVEATRCQLGCMTADNERLEAEVQALRLNLQVNPFPPSSIPPTHKLKTSRSTQSEFVAIASLKPFMLEF